MEDLKLTSLHDSIREFRLPEKDKAYLIDVYYEPEKMI